MRIISSLSWDLKGRSGEGVSAGSAAGPGWVRSSPLSRGFSCKFRSITGVACGAAQFVATLGMPELMMGMVITPAAIEEEVARQAINLGLIALLTPARLAGPRRRHGWRQVADKDVR